MHRYFAVEGSELRIGVYESSNTLCMYLESDTGGSTLENNLWVKFRIAVLNQKHPEKSEWKESAICTKTWNNSVLQFSKVCAGLLCHGILMGLRYMFAAAPKVLWGGDRWTGSHVEDPLLLGSCWSAFLHKK